MSAQCPVPAAPAFTRNDLLRQVERELRAAAWDYPPDSVSRTRLLAQAEGVLIARQVMPIPAEAQ